MTDLILRKLFDAHGCDKGGKRHGYDRVYGLLPQPKRMLEVGVLRGASLRAWIQYFPETEFVVVDNAAIDLPILQHNRVTYIQADSIKVQPEGTFDVIIDDGAHDPITQLETFNNLFPYCTGSYFIEDIWAMDALTKAQSARFKVWVDKGRLRGIDHTLDKFNRLLDAVSAHNLVRHDLRSGHNPDSYIFEIKA